MVPACIRLACRASEQVTSKDRWRHGIWQGNGYTGGPVVANTLALNHHQGEAGLPQASWATTPADRGGQA
jgi:hypothetical protein